MFEKRKEKMYDVAVEKMTSLYHEREALKPESETFEEQYHVLSEKIEAEAKIIDRLAEAESRGQSKSKINWEMLVAAGIGVAGNLMLARWTMQFQESGHLPDFKIMNAFRSRV